MKARRRLSDLRAILQITGKELRSSLRDRQTAIYTLVLPICLYPVVFWIMIQGALLVQGQRERTSVEVGVAAMRPAILPEGLAGALEQRDPEGDLPKVHVLEVTPEPSPLVTSQARDWMTGERPPPAGTGASHPDAVLYLPTPTEDIGGDPPRATIYFDSTESHSEIARTRIEERLPAFSARLRGISARDAGNDPQELEPLAVERHNIAPQRDTGALILSSMLPILLVVMTVMGAFFPAVDLTAGEKERGTAETTMLLPVPRTTIIQGKILAVCTTAVVATFLNLLAIGLSAEHLLAMLSASVDVRVVPPFLALLTVTPLALLFAFFVSAVLTGVASLAATFKEGQALLGPTQILFILPAMVGVMPGLELNLGWAFVPVVNVVLAFRAMLVSKPLYLEYVVTSGALLFYAWISIRVSARLLSREAVLMAGSTLPVKRLLAILRGAGGTR